jgi:hypothetical protein
MYFNLYAPFVSCVCYGLSDKLGEHSASGIIIGILFKCMENFELFPVNFENQPHCDTGSLHADAPDLWLPLQRTRSLCTIRGALELERSGMAASPPHGTR